MQKFVSFVVAFFVLCVGCVSGMNAVGTARLLVEKSPDGGFVIEVKEADTSKLSKPVRIDGLATGVYYSVDLGEFGEVLFGKDIGEGEGFLFIEENIFKFSEVSSDVCNFYVRLNEEEKKEVDDRILGNKLLIRTGGGHSCEFSSKLKKALFLDYKNVDGKEKVIIDIKQFVG